MRAELDYSVVHEIFEMDLGTLSLHGCICTRLSVTSPGTGALRQ